MPEQAPTPQAAGTQPARAEQAVPAPAARPEPTKPESFADRRRNEQIARAGEGRDAAWAKLQAAETMFWSAPEPPDEVPSFGSLDEPEPAREPKVSQEELHSRVVEARRNYATKTLELWRKGGIEKLSPEDLEILAEDLADTAEKSALAEMVISHHGFKNAQEMFRKLGVNEVEAFGQTFTKEQESFLKSPAVQEQLAKLGLSGGTSLATAGVITLLGGPVSWAAVGLGVGGAALGRLGGEGIRKLMLNRKVESKFGGGQVKFNEQYAREIFEVVIQMQSQIKEIQGTEDKFALTEQVLELLRGAGSPAMLAESHQSYKKTERGAAWIKAGLSLVGAVGGNLIGNAIIGHFAAADSEAAREAIKHQIQQAHEQGVWIIHDASGQAQIVAPGTEHAHFVKEQTDGLWHFAIQQRDVDAAASKHLLDQFHSYLSPDQKLPVPNVLPNHDLFHAGVVRDVDSAFDSARASALQHISHDALFAQWASAGAVGLGLLAAEGGWNAGHAIRSQAHERRVAADDRVLVGSIDEVESMLTERSLYRLADQYGVKLPQNPIGFRYNWELQPHTIPKKDFSFEKIPTWVPRNAVADRGRLIEYGVASVDVARNRIAVVTLQHQNNSGAEAYVCSVMRLDEFIRDNKPIIKQQGGRAA